MDYSISFLFHPWSPSSPKSEDKSTATPLGNPLPNTVILDLSLNYDSRKVSQTINGVVFQPDVSFNYLDMA